jgi:flagellin-like hook-associated protein FlgL
MDNTKDKPTKQVQEILQQIVKDIEKTRASLGAVTAEVEKLIGGKVQQMLKTLSTEQGEQTRASIRTFEPRLMR